MLYTGIKWKNHSYFVGRQFRKIPNSFVMTTRVMTILTISPREFLLNYEQCKTRNYLHLSFHPCHKRQQNIQHHGPHPVNPGFIKFVSIYLQNTLNIMILNFFFIFWLSDVSCLCRSSFHWWLSRYLGHKSPNMTVMALRPERNLFYRTHQKNLH